MSNREISTDEYYEAMFEMFGTKGWGFFMELLELDKEKLEQIIWNDCDDSTTVAYRKHHKVLDTLISFADKTREDYALVKQQLQEEAEEEEDV